MISKQGKVISKQAILGGDTLKPSRLGSGSGKEGVVSQAQPAFRPHLVHCASCHEDGLFQLEVVHVVI